MESYETLSEAINALKKQGYTEDFNLKENCIECRDGHYKVFHDEFVIDKFFRFEDNTDPSDQSVLYAISSEKYKLKGLLVNGYGIYSDPIANEMMEKLKMHSSSIKILGFAGSNSKNSINKKLVQFALKSCAEYSTTLIDLNDFEMPLFSVDREKENGYPKQVAEFLELIKSHDALLISLAEHNRSYTVAFKNIFDWCSRVNLKLFQEKPMFLMSTSPGKGGAINVMNEANKSFPQFGAKIISSFSLPSFKENFSDEEGIKDPDLKNMFSEKINIWLKELKAREEIQKQESSAEK